MKKQISAYFSNAYSARYAAARIEESGNDISVKLRATDNNESYFSNATVIAAPFQFSAIGTQFSGAAFPKRHTADENGAPQTAVLEIKCPSEKANKIQRIILDADGRITEN